MHDRSITLAAADAATMRKSKSVPAARKPGKKPLSKAERRAETTEQILDEAEYLFSKHGLYGVT